MELLQETMDYRERFVNFLKSFQDKNGNFKYRDAIAHMASSGKTSLVIDFDDLISYDPDLAAELKDKPVAVLQKANLAISDAMRAENMDYAAKVKEFRARFRRLDEVIPLRALKSSLMGKLIMVEGIITRASVIKQLLKVAVFQCPKCGEKIKMEQTGTVLIMPPQCTNPDCARKGYFRLIPEESNFVDWQMIQLQERPEELPPGQLPRSIECVLQGDIVDVTRPGDRVYVVGVLQAKQEFTSKGFRLATFSTGIDANYIEISEKGTEEVQITPEDERAIKELSKDPLLYQKIFSSIAPSIYGYEEIKEAIAYQLVGGVTKVMPDGIKIRGDINILLVGDPGTAKSQLLQYIAKIAPRGIYTSGKGSTAAGLTATVIRDKNTNEFFLEAGALVIADKGVACIDEIDKMRPEDRSAIHEAMEQQSYHPSFEIILSDGSKHKIGTLVDALFERYPERVVKGIDCEILPISDIGIELFTTDFSRVFKTKVDRVSRHKAPPHFVKITYSDGRKIIVTPEHPVFVYRGNKITTVEASRVKIGEIAPALVRDYDPSQNPDVGMAAPNKFLDPEKLSVIRVEILPNDGELRTEFVYDVTVEPTHTFISNGLILHNTISIAKAGIVVQLNARTSILAAANPTFGRYVPQRSIAENISELPVTIISRFDLIFVLIDRPEEARDRAMTEHILSLHQGVPLGKVPTIDPAFLKKYFYYVRKNAHPKLSLKASKKIEEFFLEMRSKGEGADSPVPITMRQLEAVIRLAEARAKLALKDEVTEEDVEPVTKLMRSYLMQVGMDRATGKVDIDTIMVGRPKSASDKLAALFDLLMAMQRENEMGPIKRESFIARAEVEGFNRNFVENAIAKWTNEGIIYEAKPGYIKKA